MQKKKRKMKKSTPKNPKAHLFVEKVELKKDENQRNYNIWDAAIVMFSNLLLIH